MNLLERIRQLDPRPLKGPTLAHLRLVEDENAMLRKHAAKQITDATLLTGINIHGGGMEVGMKGGAAGVLVEQLAQQFVDSGAINFLEMTFASAEMLPGEQFVVTIQRVHGETPGMQLKRLKAELAAATGEPPGEPSRKEPK